MKDTYFIPWPKNIADTYRTSGCWTGEFLDQIIDVKVEKNNDQIAFIDGEKSVTYLEFYASIEKYSYLLCKQGLKSGDKVVLHMENCLEFFEMFFSLLRIGVMPVLALPLHRYQEIKYFCEKVGAVAYISHFANEKCEFRRLAKKLVESKLVKQVITPSSLVLSDEVTKCQSSVSVCENAIANRKPSDIAFFLLSGGTTGKPKLIARTHDDYAYSVRASSDVCELSSREVYLAVLPISHNFILSSPGVLGVLNKGGTVVIAQNPDPESAFKLIKQHKITMLALVPPLVIAWLSAAENRLRAKEKIDLSSLRLVQVGGAKLSVSVAKKIEPSFGCRLQQVFGMAEGLVNYTRLNDSLDVIVATQGRPMSSFDEVKVVDDDDKPVLPGEEGHLLTRGPYTIRGYYNSPEHNARSFTSDGFYRTGDLVRQRESGHLIVTGRSKDQINRGGEKVAAEEVENYLLDHPEVSDVALVSMPDEYLGERSCAYIIVKNGGGNGDNLSSLKRDLVSYMRTLDVASYKIPDRIELVSEFPKTKFGKVDKRALREKIIGLMKSNETNMHKKLCISV